MLPLSRIAYFSSTVRSLFQSIDQEYIPENNSPLDGLLGQIMSSESPIFPLLQPNPVYDRAIFSTFSSKGWIKTVRNQKETTFIEFNDGSTSQNLQLVINNMELLKDSKISLNTGACIGIKGNIVTNTKSKAKVPECQITELEIFGDADPLTYPIQKKFHSDATLLHDYPEFRPKTTKFLSSMLIRSKLFQSFYQFFSHNNFTQVHTPILTSSDCEGAGEMFSVFSQTHPNFFGQNQEAKLSVSGQLEGEFFSSGMNKIYTCGPTFRAEDSNTSRHLSEFWMLEPEIAFADLSDTMKVVEQLVSFCVANIVLGNLPELKTLSSYWTDGIDSSLNKFKRAPQQEKALSEHLQPFINCYSYLLQHPENEYFQRITYSEAIDVLQGIFPKESIKFGLDLGSKYENALIQHFGNLPIFLTHFPASQKPFYTYCTVDSLQDYDPKSSVTNSMDFLVPKIGELVGGTQRETRLDILQHRMQEMDVSDLDWYLNLRKYGNFPHSGFGLGVERLVRYITGLDNIRNAIGVPRFPGYISV